MMSRLDVARRLPVNGAAHRVARSKHLLHCAGQRASHGALAHGACDVDDLVQGDVAVVLDVLHLKRCHKDNRSTATTRAEGQGGGGVI